MEMGVIMESAIVCEDTGEVAGSYAEYLRTAHWAKTREAAYLVHGRTCARCGRTDGLNMHHLTYLRIGRENVLFDLVPLCREHHVEEHLAHSGSRRFIAHVNEVGGELCESVLSSALAYLNARWLESDLAAAAELEEWLERNKPAILGILRNSHYNGVYHNLEMAYPDQAQYEYIKRSAWWVGLIDRKRKSCGG